MIIEISLWMQTLTVDCEYSPAEPATKDSPAYKESVEINAVYINRDAALVNIADLLSEIRCEKGYAIGQVEVEVLSAIAWNRNMAGIDMAIEANADKNDKREAYKC